LIGTQKSESVSCFTDYSAADADVVFMWAFGDFTFNADELVPDNVGGHFH
jgi:hypothetical protein